MTLTYQKPNKKRTNASDPQHKTITIEDLTKKDLQDWIAFLNWKNYKIIKIK